MSRGTKTTFALLAIGLAAGDAKAQVCDYRPSELLRWDRAAAAAANVRDEASRVLSEGAAVLTLRDIATGASLLGAGSGRAGALSQIATTAGSAAIGVVTTPGASLAGGAAIVGAGAYEGLCYLRLDRIADYDDVLAILTSVAAFADPSHFRIEDDGPGPNGAKAIFGDGMGATIELEVTRLRIVDGVLLLREWGRDTELGNLGMLTSIAFEDR